MPAAIINKQSSCASRTLDNICHGRHAEWFRLFGKNSSTNLEIPCSVLAYFQTCRNQAFGIASMVRVHVVAVLQALQAVEDRG